MGAFKKLLTKDTSLSLVFSLPENKLELAEAALTAGVDALKVHANVNHRASGTIFSSLEEERPKLEPILKIAGDTLVGIVPRGQGVITVDEAKQLRDLGFSFLSAYAHHYSADVLSVPGINKMVAADYSYKPDHIKSWYNWGVDVLEASIIAPNGYGQPLNFQDICSYEDLKVGLPMLIPTQRKILPSDVPSLNRLGANALMLGAVVTGKTPEKVYKKVKEFREAIDKISMLLNT